MELHQFTAAEDLFLGLSLALIKTIEPNSGHTSKFKAPTNYSKSDA